MDDDAPLLLHSFGLLDLEAYSANSVCLPSGIAIGRQGEYVVVDHSNSAVRVFHPTGQQLLVVGERELASPWDVAVTATAGRYAVTDVEYNDVKVFSPKGHLVATSCEGHHLCGPRGIAYSGDGRELAVADGIAACVFVHDRHGVVEAVIRLPPGEGRTSGGEDRPADDEGRPVDAEGHPVDDEGHSVDDEGHPVDGESRSVDARPDYVTFDSQGHLYVSYSRARCVCRYDRDVAEPRRHVFTYTLAGVPAGLCTDSDDNVLIADRTNRCVHVVNGAGRLVGLVLTAADGLTKPQSLAVDHSDRLVVLEATGTINVFHYGRALDRLLSRRAPHRTAVGDTTETHRAGQ